MKRNSSLLSRKFELMIDSLTDFWYIREQQIMIISRVDLRCTSFITLFAHCLFCTANETLLVNKLVTFDSFSLKSFCFDSRMSLPKSQWTIDSSCLPQSCKSRLCFRLNNSESVDFIASIPRCRSWFPSVFSRQFHRNACHAVMIVSMFRQQIITHPWEKTMLTWMIDAWKGCRSAWISRHNLVLLFVHSHEMNGSWAGSWNK